MPVLDRDDRRFCRDQCLAAAHVALQQPVHRLSGDMSLAISASTRFCALVGLNGSMALIFSRDAIVEFERNAVAKTRLRTFQGQARIPARRTPQR